MVLIVGCAVAPAHEEDALPLEGQGAHGCRMGLAAGLLILDEEPRPLTMQGGLAGVFVKALEEGSVNESGQALDSQRSGEKGSGFLLKMSHAPPAAPRVHRIDLEQMRALSGGDSRKRGLARALARHTAVKQGWIAQRLALGSASHVSHLTARYEKVAGTRCKAPDWMS